MIVKCRHASFIRLTQLHLLSAVQVHIAFLQVHLPVQPATALQPHLISSPHAWDAMESVVQNGTHHWLSMSNVQPHPSAAGTLGWETPLVDQIPAWKTEHFVCSSRADYVGRMAFMVLFCLQNISVRASFTELSWLVHWYKTTVKRSRLLKLPHWLSNSLNGVIAMLLNAFVASGKHFHASHASPAFPSQGVGTQYHSLWSYGILAGLRISPFPGPEHLYLCGGSNGDFPCQKPPIY